MHDPYLKRSQPDVYNFVQPAVDGWSVAAVTTRSKVPCVLKLAMVANAALWPA